MAQGFADCGLHFAQQCIAGDNGRARKQIVPIAGKGSGHDDFGIGIIMIAMLRGLLRKGRRGEGEKGNTGQERNTGHENSKFEPVVRRNKIYVTTLQQSFVALWKPFAESARRNSVLT